MKFYESNILTVKNVKYTLTTNSSKIQWKKNDDIYHI